MIRPILAAALALAPVAASAQFVRPPPDHQPIRPPSRSGPCDDAEHHQFDFWIGRWTVSPTGSRKVVATSVIEKLYRGCAIRENWTPIGEAGGGSLTSYVPAERAWRQTWVDSSGGRAEFRGEWTGQAMVMVGSWPMPDGRARLIRMTYTPLRDGAVRQAGEASFDNGRTWTPTFNFTYRRTVRALPLRRDGGVD